MTQATESSMQKDGSRLEFPRHIMKGAAEFFAKVHAEHFEAPMHFFFLAYLAALGNLFADLVTLSTELKPQSRLFLVLLAESASARKSTVLNLVMNHFEHITSALTYSVCFGVGSAEGLAQQLKAYPKTLLFYDELNALVRKCLGDRMVLLPCINSLFERNSYQSRTKDKNIIVDPAYLSLVSACTSETYESMFTSQFQSIGFVNRLFVAHGSSHHKISFPEKIDPGLHERMRTATEEIVQFVEVKAKASPNHMLELELAEDAKDLYQTWYCTVEDSEYSKRLDSYALRFMILLAVNERRQIVELDIVERVIDLMNWELEIRKVFSPIDADTRIARMEEKVRRSCRKRGYRSLTLKDKRQMSIIKRDVHASRDGLWVFNKAVENLIKAGEFGVWRD